MSDEKISPLEKKFLDMVNERKKLSKDHKEPTKEEKESFKKLVGENNVQHTRMIHPSSHVENYNMEHLSYMAHPSSQRENDYNSARIFHSQREKVLKQRTTHGNDNMEHHTFMAHPSSGSSRKFFD